MNSKVILRTGMFLLILCLALSGCAPAQVDDSQSGGQGAAASPESGAAASLPPTAGAVAEPPATDPVFGGSLTFVVSSDPQTLDSRGNMSGPGRMTGYQVQEGLLSTDPVTGTAAPGLAKDWNVSEDGLVWTFYLREGVKFHDGTDFDANDVLYTFSFLTGEREGGIYVSQFSPFIKLIEAPDQYTVVLKLTSPWTDLETHLRKHWATLILSQEAVEAAGENYGVSVMVGTGPFKFMEWNEGESVVLEKNADYWNQPYPYLDKLVFRPIVDSSAALVAAQSEVVDIIDAPPIDQLAGISGNESLAVYSVPANPMASLQINTADAPFNDVRVRQALYCILDREGLTNAFLGQYAEVARDMLPSWHPYHDPDYMGVEYDPERAVQLLAEAGYDKNNPLKFVAITSTDAAFQRLSVFIQAQLLEYGIEMQIRPLESAVRLATMAGTDGFNRDDYDLAVQRQTLGGSTIDDYIYKFYGKEGSLNRMFYNKDDGFQNPEMEGMISEARTCPNVETQKQLYRKVIEKLTQDAVLIPLYYENQVFVVNNRVQNFVPAQTLLPFTQVWVIGE